MDRIYPQGGSDNFDDQPPSREHEERASRRILLAMLGAALTVGGLYAFGVLCGVVARTV